MRPDMVKTEYRGQDLVKTINRTRRQDLVKTELGDKIWLKQNLETRFG